jgi:epoxyqueuosine reductase QueG
MTALDQPVASAKARSLLASILSGPGGPSAWSFLSHDCLSACCAGLSPELRSRFGVDSARGAAVAALAYSDGPVTAPAWAEGYQPPALRLARFARADWYGELSSRLRLAVKELRQALIEDGVDPGPARDWHYLSNSRLPEKPLALAGGLGRLGRNGLVIVGRAGGPEARGAEASSLGESSFAAGAYLGSSPEIGPGAVLGLLLLPFDPEEGRPEAAMALERIVSWREVPAFLAGATCGSCRACIEACPTGALSQSRDGQAGGILYQRELCLQHWSALSGGLPPEIEAAWAGRLYGCDACLEACPRFHPDPLARCDRGLLGPTLPARLFLALDDAELKACLRGTVLGLGWMNYDAFRRSARLALASFDAKDQKL